MFQLRDIHLSRVVGGENIVGITEETFDDLFFETFVTRLSDGSEVPLMNDGENKPVTFAARGLFVDLALRARLNENCEAVECLKQGLASIIPAEAMSLFDWREVEDMINGVEGVDIELLRQHTKPSASFQTPEGAQLIEWFWKVLESFDASQREAFLRFVWGRSRLPRQQEFGEDFKIHLMDVQEGSADRKLPKADTCFFALHLPLYTNEEVLRTRLLFAVLHCADMDADFDPGAHARGRDQQEPRRDREGEGRRGGDGSDNSSEEEEEGDE
mmetsp:Transcript_16193/g.40989  ORF Transcript_16193/g.40989 Transcript_16193/m.40989 type:complete len:272 (+) Transcript_16193:1597-2412(+)